VLRLGLGSLCWDLRTGKAGTSSYKSRGVCRASNYPEQTKYDTAKNVRFAEDGSKLYVTGLEAWVKDAADDVTADEVTRGLLDEKTDIIRGWENDGERLEEFNLKY